MLFRQSQHCPHVPATPQTPCSRVRLSGYHLPEANVVNMWVIFLRYDCLQLSMRDPEDANCERTFFDPSIITIG